MPLTVRGSIRLAILVGILIARASARADTLLKVDVGWGGITRSGRWTPLFITVADSKPRNAILELNSPHDATQAMNIELPVAVGPLPQSYVMYAPLMNGGEPTVLSLRQTNGKLIKDVPVVDTYGVSEDGSRQNPFSIYTGPFIGVSGAGPALAALQQGSQSPTVAYLAPARLPWTFRGYNALDILVLNQPNLVSINREQQSAIRDWVEAGGTLVLWPGDDPLPPSGPIIGLLPGKVGDLTTLSISKPTLRSAGLGPRFGSFTARTIEPEADARVVKLLGDSGAVAVTAYRGLGKVTLLNFDASALLFDNSSDQERFVKTFLDLSGPANVNLSEVRTNEQAQATGQIMDLMGDVPGVGTFGFGYVATVMLAMIAIVGPIDWFVLKRMKRQPWTWITTSGWIALITLVALSLGSVLRSGELHFRTVSLIDQVGDKAVARMDTLGLYSHRTAEYRFEVAPASWWEPMTTDMYSYSREVIRPLPFRQGADDNTPVEDTVHVWNLRFMIAELQGKSEASIGNELYMTAADQKPPAKGKPPRVVRGTITNLSHTPLTNLWLRTKGGLFDLTTQPTFPKAGLDPGATMKIDLPLQPRGVGFTPWSTVAVQPQYNYGRYGQPVEVTPLRTPVAMLKAACEIPADRARIIEDRINNGGPLWAVVYGGFEPIEGPVKLLEQKPKARHWQFVRALVQLHDGPQSQPKAGDLE